MIRKSTQVAMGGIASGLCLVFMLLTMMIPFSTFVFPAVSGMVLIAVAYENGAKTAYMVYVAVSILSIMLVPDKEAAMLFIGFFGYYPTLKPFLDKQKNKTIRILLKAIIFNASIIITYLIIINLFGIADVLEEVGMLGKYTVPFMLIILNLLFISLDNAISKLTYVYIYWFRPKFLKKIG